MGSVVTKFCGLRWMIYTRWSDRSGMMCYATVIQSNPFIRTLTGAIESIRIKRVEFRENVRVFFPPGTRQTVRNNDWGVRNAGFDSSAGLYMFKSVCSYWALTVIVFLRPEKTHVPTNCGLAILMKKPVIKKKKRKRISAVLLLRGHQN